MRIETPATGLRRRRSERLPGPPPFSRGNHRENEVRRRPPRDETAHRPTPLEDMFAETHVVEASRPEPDCICGPGPTGSQTTTHNTYDFNQTASGLQRFSHTGHGRPVAWIGSVDVRPNKLS